MWKIKLLTQFGLVHIPFGEAVNHRLQRINGRINEADILERMSKVGERLAHLVSMRPLEGIDVVEVGTGWDALPTMMLYAGGAKRIHTYDHVAHLRADLVYAVTRIFASNVELVSRQVGSPVPAVKERLSRALSGDSLDLTGFLERTNITYHAPADAATTGLSDHSINLHYSHAVMLHVPEPVAEAIAIEARRVLRPEGLYYSAIGLQDQFSFDPKVSEVNFLKYPEWLWSLLAKNKITYTNRLRERDFLGILRRHGARILDVESVVKPENVELVKSMKVAKRFAGYSPEELATTGTVIIAGWPGIKATTETCGPSETPIEHARPLLRT